MDSNPAPTVAVFDFDGTLTRCDSLFPFLRYTVGRWTFWRRTPLIFVAGIRHRLGQLDRTTLKESILRTYLGGLPEYEADVAAQGFVRRVLPSLINPAAEARLGWHRERHHRLLVISASLETYLGHWASATPGIEAVLATRLQTVQGTLTGLLDGPNCTGPEKLHRLIAHLGTLEDQQIYVYGDSAGDRDLLETAQLSYYRSFETRWGRLFGYARLLKALL